MTSNKIKFDIRGKVAWISGAASGFGYALAIELVKNGCCVALIDFNENGGKEIEKKVNSIRENSGVFFLCDVSNFDALKETFDKTVKHFGRLDIVCNNAGINVERPQQFETDVSTAFPQKLKLLIDVNLTAVVLGTYYAIQYLKKNPEGGVILNTASMAGTTPIPATPVYAATKSGVVNLTRSLQHLKHTYNIRVNASCPAFADTNIIKSTSRETMEKLEGGILPVETVISGMMDLITDKSKAGAIQVVRYKSGIQYWPYSRNKSQAKL